MIKDVSEAWGKPCLEAEVGADCIRIEDSTPLGGRVDGRNEYLVTIIGDPTIISCEVICSGVGDEVNLYKGLDAALSFLLAAAEEYTSPNGKRYTVGEENCWPQAAEWAYQNDNELQSLQLSLRAAEVGAL